LPTFGFSLFSIPVLIIIWAWK